MNSLMCNWCISKQEHFFDYNFSKFEIALEVFLNVKQKIINFSITEKIGSNSHEKIKLLPTVKKKNDELIALWESEKYGSLITEINNNKNIFFKNFFSLDDKEIGKEIKKWFEEEINKNLNDFYKKILLEESEKIIKSLYTLRGDIFKNDFWEEEFKKLSETDMKTISRFFLDSYFIVQNFLFLRDLGTELKKK